MKIAKVTVMDSGEVTVTFTVVPEKPTGPITLPEQVRTQVVPPDQVPEMIRQWLGP